MSKPTLHLIGLSHTICNHDFDHCAFTGKVLRFPKMMQAQGYRVIEYSNGDSLSSAEHAQVLTEEELYKMLPTNNFLLNASARGKNWEEFNKRLIRLMRMSVKPGDIVCHPFGPAHPDAMMFFPQCYHVESGIGYSAQDFCPYRIFESYAFMHFQQGNFRKDDGNYGRHGRDYEWVIPNYYDVDDWKPVEKHGDYLLYFGRIQEDKGLLIVREIAERQGIPVKIVGMGDPRPYMGDNVTSGPPITGADAKNALLGGARAILMPTRYVEPFGGSGVEAMLCGTPVISSDFGAFTETVEHGKTGFRCHTLGDYLAAIEAIPSLDRKYIAERARTLYSLETVGKKYDSVFQQIVDLGDAGWFTERSYTIGG